MRTESKATRAADGARLERAIVLQLLRDDRERRWPRARLGSELDGGGPEVEDALRRLSADGVLCLSERAVWASRAARRLDELGLLCV